MEARSTARIALDVHCHLIPIDAPRLAGLAGVQWDAAGEQLVLGQHSIGLKELFRPEALVAWLERNRVEQAWVSPPQLAYRQELDAGAALIWAGYLNQGLSELCARTERGLSPLYHLPLEHPAVAEEVAAEWIGRGQRRFAAPVGGCSRLSDPALEGLWRRLDQAGCFVFLHPGQCCDARLGQYYLELLVGNYFETAVAVAHLIFSGILERHPQIQFCLAHGGGMSAAVAPRLQRGYETRRPGLDPALQPPREMMHRFMADCVVHDAAVAVLNAQAFGQNRIVFGSDWPFAVGLLDPHAQLASFDSALRAKILQDNPRALLRQFHPAAG